MSTLLANRVQSAYSRHSYRSGTDGQTAHLRQRPTSSISAQSAPNRAFPHTALDTHGPSPPVLSASSRRHRRAKATSASTTTSTRPASRKLRSDEIDSLVETLERQDTYIVEVDSLVGYQTLVQTIDLRRTPIDCHVLCALQQRENRIVQKNACRDVRFLSLLEALEPTHTSSDQDQSDSDDSQRMDEPGYPPGDSPYTYIK